MSKQNRPNSPSTAKTLAYARPGNSRAMHPVPFILGLMFLALAGAAALMLALDHLGAIALPGCGEGSPCAELAQGPWGRLPGLGWPVSFVGLAYFGGALVMWLLSFRGASWLFRNVARVGVLGSVGFVAAMIFEHHLCQWCVATHVGNLGFWLTLELSRRRSPLQPVRIFTSTAIFASTLIVLLALQTRAQRLIHEQGERDLVNATNAIIEATSRAAAAASQAANATIVEGANDDGEATIEPLVNDTTASAPANTTTPATDQTRPFCGRYVYGPEKAAVRIVMITDYQCPDCRRKEQEVQTLLKQHDNISLSIKHFPFCRDCNKYALRTLHPNACWAARAAEAAGILYGNEGFFRMHFWLFEHSGRFETRAILENAVREIGYDPAGFVDLMQDDETLRLVQSDIEEAHNLGIWQTPMIFINGVELRGWYADNAVIRAVEQVLATNPPPLTHEFDHPPGTIEKCVGDWRYDQERFHIVRARLLPFPEAQPLGAPDAAIKIVIFGDYEEPTTAEADAIVRAWVAARNDASYVFRHYPFHPDCNPHIQRALHEHACWAAQVAEAVALVGGADARWRMHAWLMSHEDQLNEAALRAAAPELGIDINAVLAAMQRPEVAAAIERDTTTGKRLGFKGIPTIYVNGGQVQRWRWQGAEQGREILEAILNTAAAEAH